MSLIYLPKSDGAKLIPSKQGATSAWANMRMVLHNPPESCVSSHGEFQPFPSHLHSRAIPLLCVHPHREQMVHREPHSFMGYADTQGTNFWLDNQLQFRTVVSPKDARGT